MKEILEFLESMIDPIVFLITIPCKIVGIPDYWAFAYIAAIILIPIIKIAMKRR